MTKRSLFAVALAASIVAPMTAQDTCPWQTTQHVAADVIYGPSQDCGGIDYRISEIQILSPKGPCPLFVIYVPAHDLVVPSPMRTRVDVIAQQPITKCIFECQSDWFLFIPLGSTCVFVRQINLGALPTLITRPCDPLPT